MISESNEIDECCFESISNDIENFTFVQNQNKEEPESEISVFLESDLNALKNIVEND
jgi:hypothetical protein